MAKKTMPFAIVLSYFIIHFQPKKDLALRYLRLANSFDIRSGTQHDGNEE